MKNWINNLIAFFRFIFKSKMPNRPVVNQDWDPRLVFSDEHDSLVVVGATSPENRDLPGELLARRIVAYMEKMGYYIDRNPSNGNIVYISEMRDYFGVPKDEIDEWDDTRNILRFHADGRPYIDFFQSASTEPGSISRTSAAAKKLGGVATVVPGQYKAWKFGYHKHNHDHPALVQCANITIWRDRNENARFDNEMMFSGVYGINQHSTKPGFSGPRIGLWSAGCLVGKNFEQHLEFLDRLKQWECYKANPECVFYTTIIPGKALWKEESPLSV